MVFAPRRRLCCLACSAATASWLAVHLLLASHATGPRSRQPLRDTLIVLPESVVEERLLSGRRRRPAARMAPPPPPPTPAEDAVPSEAREDAGCALLLAIPTAPRSHNEDYLNLTLEALLCQLPPAELASRRVCIAVYDARPRPAGVSTAASAAYDDSPFARAARWRPDLLYARPSPAQVEAAAAAEADATDSKAQRTRRQTVDVAHMLQQLAPKTSSVLVLLEDDWLLCEGGGRGTLSVAARAMHLSARRGSRGRPPGRMLAAVFGTQAGRRSSTWWRRRRTTHPTGRRCMWQELSPPVPRG
jgi:hypothetical protein